MIDSFRVEGSFLCRDGLSRKNSEEHSNKKLCFVATDREFLMRELLELSQLDHCFFVKLTANPRDGMYLGRCFLTNDKWVGHYWAKYKLHPKMMCNIQDDDFSEPYRKDVKRYD